MSEMETGLSRAVLYTLSGGFVSVAFGVLGATAAQAKPIPDDNVSDPVSAMKVAGSVPGMGVFKVAADAANKVAQNSGEPKTKSKSGNSDGNSHHEDGGGEQQSKRPSREDDSGSDQKKPKEQDRDSDQHKAPPSRDRESSEKALQLAGSLPGMGAAKVLSDARSRAETHADVQDVLSPLLTAGDKPSNGADSFPLRLPPGANDMPRGADPERKRPPKADEVAHGRVVDRGAAGDGKFEEDHGDGVTTVLDLKTGLVALNDLNLGRNAPPAAKLVPLLQQKVTDAGPVCGPWDTPDCPDRKDLRTDRTTTQIIDLCSTGKIECSNEFEQELIATHIAGGDQPPEGTVGERLATEVIVNSVGGVGGRGIRTGAGAATPKVRPRTQGAAPGTVSGRAGRPAGEALPAAPRTTTPTLPSGRGRSTPAEGDGAAAPQVKPHTSGDVQGKVTGRTAGRVVPSPPPTAVPTLPSAQAGTSPKVSRQQSREPLPLWRQHAPNLIDETTNRAASKAAQQAGYPPLPLTYEGMPYGPAPVTGAHTVQPKSMSELRGVNDVFSRIDNAGNFPPMPKTKAQKLIYGVAQAVGGYKSGTQPLRGGGYRPGVTHGDEIPSGADTIPYTNVPTSFTTADVSRVRAHLSRPGLDHFEPNDVMLDRIGKALADGKPLSEGQTNFMRHESLEAKLMDGGMGYGEAHAEASKTHSPGRNYDPDVIDQEPLFGSWWRKMNGLGPR